MSAVFRVSYDITTPESAVDGNAAEYGYVLPGGWHAPMPPALCGPAFTAWRDVEAPPMRLRDACRLCCPCRARTNDRCGRAPTREYAQSCVLRF